jgi:hypothetical protein
MGDLGVGERQGRAAAYWFGHLDPARATAAPPASGLFARAEIREALPGARTASQRLHLPGGAVLAWEGAADLALIDPLLGR